MNRYLLLRKQRGLILKLWSQSIDLKWNLGIDRYNCLSWKISMFWLISPIITNFTNDTIGGKQPDCLTGQWLPVHRLAGVGIHTNDFSLVQPGLFHHAWRPQCRVAWSTDQKKEVGTIDSFTAANRIQSGGFISKPDLHNKRTYSYLLCYSCDSVYVIDSMPSPRLPQGMPEQGRLQHITSSWPYLLHPVDVFISSLIIRYFGGVVFRNIVTLRGWGEHGWFSWSRYIHNMLLVQDRKWVSNMMFLLH